MIRNKKGSLNNDKRINSPGRLDNPKICMHLTPESKYKKQKLTALKRKMDKASTTVGDLNALLSNLQNY